MNPSRTSWWVIFSAAALVVVAALMWATVAVMRLEKRELAARADARQQESLRLALWRMDSWLSPRLAREAARPYFEYLPYYPQQRAYTSLLSEIQPGEVLTPSPLLTMQSEFFPIHFQLEADGTLTSPQVPTGNLRDLAEATALSGEQINAKQAMLDEISRVLNPDALAVRLNAAEEHLAIMSCEPAEEGISLGRQRDELGQSLEDSSQQLAGNFNASPQPQQQAELSKREYQQRAMASNIAQQADAGQTFNAPETRSGAKAMDDAPAAGLAFELDEDAREQEAAQLISVGPLVAMWTDGGVANVDAVSDEPREAPDSAHSAFGEEDAGSDNGGGAQNRPVSSSPIAASYRAEMNRGSSDTASVALSSGGGSSDTASILVFVRRVTVGDDVRFQGFLADWPALRSAMLDQVRDLFSQAQLVAVSDTVAADDPSARILATVPAELITPPEVMPAIPMMTPARLTLALTWLAVIGAIIAAGVTLHHSIAYAAKRSRFTSAVTHELRTPLTTFRMYSEMLAENMVRDDAQRKNYLQTLKSESARLATLVENVLAYARLEEGRLPKHAQRMTVHELLARVRPMLERRAAEAGLTICMDAVSNRPVSSSPNAARDRAKTTRGSSDTASIPLTSGGGSSDTASSIELSRAITIDADAVGQILFNLVDNACKYASGVDVAQRSIDIDAHLHGQSLRIVVRDHGPGIPVECARTIFRPFDRGRHGPGDTTPGVGLGLALARGLARDLGGDLTLEQPRRGSGAQFVLSLPM